eukprot:9542772-Karenia_brevis.AAC.1
MVVALDRRFITARRVGVRHLEAHWAIAVDHWHCLSLLQRHDQESTSKDSCIKFEFFVSRVLTT